RPVRRATPFAVLGRPLQFLPKLLFCLITDGLHLGRAESRADHKIIRKRFELAEVDDRNCGCFFVLRCLYGKTHTLRQSVEFHRYKPCSKMYPSTSADTSPWMDCPRLTRFRMSVAETSLATFSSRYTLVL